MVDAFHIYVDHFEHKKEVYRKNDGSNTAESQEYESGINRQIDQLSEARRKKKSV